MSYGIYTDRKQRPTEDEVAKIVSSKYDLWKNLITFINRKYKTKSEYKFYGKNYGWALRFNKSGKSLIAFYPGNNEFTVQIILNKEQIYKALKSEISKKIISIIKSTSFVHEGKWLFIRITNKNDLNEIKTLLQIRA